MQGGWLKGRTKNSEHLKARKPMAASAAAAAVSYCQCVVRSLRCMIEPLQLRAHGRENDQSGSPLPFLTGGFGYWWNECVLGTIFVRLRNEVFRTPPSRWERKDARINWIGETTFPFFFFPDVWAVLFVLLSFLFPVFFYFLRMTPLSFSFAEMLLRKVRVSKRGRSRCAIPGQSLTIFLGISMKSQFYHSSRFTSPSSRSLPPSFLSYISALRFYVYVFLFFVIFVPLSFRDIFSSRDRAHGSSAAIPKSWLPVPLYNPSTISVQSRTREIARSSHGIKYATERVGYTRIRYRVAINQSCSMKEPRRAAVSAPPSRRGRRSRKRAPGPGPTGYNLYTKINAFFFFSETLNKRIVQNVTLFVPYTEISFCFFVCTKYVSLCAQHSSRPFTNRSSVTFSPPFFSVFAPLFSV